jgi:23S rRNA (cytosine1962-C5)-methyltransferase
MLGRHPWIFSGSVDRLEGAPAPGAEVGIVAADGTPLGRGLWNPHSQIRVRVYGWDPAAPLDRDFWAARIDAALAARQGAPELAPPTPVRLVFSEADGLSGLVVDRLDAWLVVQVTSLALWTRIDLVADLLEARLAPRGILLRTEKGVREEEGLDISDGVLRGEGPDGPVLLQDGSPGGAEAAAGEPAVREPAAGEAARAAARAAAPHAAPASAPAPSPGTPAHPPLRFLADLGTGQKTGFYLDQRANRRAVARWAQGRRAADICCYSGGFALHLLRGGARSVVGVDASAPALELAARNAAENGLAEGVEWIRSDALRWMTAAAEAGERFDLVVLDPPRFARSRRGVPAALRGYGRLNEAAVALLEPGGLLATFSCSGRVTREAFQGVLAGVAARTGRRLRVVESYGQPVDHPVDPCTPETAYLKGLLLRVE